MNEYIKRKNLVDLVLSKLKYLGDARIMNEGDEKVLSEIDGYEKALEDVHKLILDKDLIENIQPVNRWISCKDKMPEDNTLVLFVYVSENGVKSVHYGYHQTLKGLGSSWAKPSGGWQYCDDAVTHWQPLPEPPKDGDTECQ